MKRMLAVLLSAAMLFSVTACGSKPQPAPEPTQAPDKNITQPTEGTAPTEPEPEPPAQSRPLALLTVQKEDQFLWEWAEDECVCKATWQELTLGEESAARYPALADSLWELNTDCSVGAWSFMEENRQAALDRAAQDEPFGSYSSEEELILRRADEKIVSVLSVQYSYAKEWSHPYYGVGGFNYDPETGERLDISDVLTDTAGLDALLAEKLQTRYDFINFGDLNTSLEQYHEVGYNWTMDYQGVTFWFNPYDIAAFAAGLFRVTLWFDEYPDLIREEYRQAPEGGWIVELPEAYEMDVDLRPGDGERDSLMVWKCGMENNMDGYYPVIECDSTEYTDYDYYAYEMSYYLACLGDEGEQKFYLWVDSVAENDYSTFRVYDLNGSEITRNGALSGTGLQWVGYEDDEGNYGGRSCIPNDWANLFLETHLDILGTMEGSARYSADKESGMPVAQTDYYELPADRPPLTTLIPVEVEILPMFAWEQLPVGTQLWFLRTDGESYVDMKLADGRECRVTVEEDPENWWRCVNGVSEWDCFDGLLYAG